ncbi:uncharacterized protein J4E84_008623 [Alternaria hordeiaustralica]|uniref:uncharacterized protein n=1 Tax=Alternaria hordeiaustralica TaxID=1187925 RepID=UPI0020C45FD3|nr:uncharacterized protein J4E84_008623 [Alternaria hordeiaustralica]KAI4678804.1 hypothetical protein J4E84_008623 [Alternaria hordeiaustralica]
MSSINAEISNAVSEIATRNMTQSPLLRLPGELRNKIFAYAVGGHIITVNLVPLAAIYESSDDEDEDEDEDKDEDEDDYEDEDKWTRSEDYSYEQLEFRLATAAQPKPSKELLTRGYHSRYHIDSGVSLDGFLKGNASTRVSNIFTVSRVCRQIYTETALLQYKTNYFHFDVPALTELFVKQLTSDQLHAIPAISIGDGYRSQEWFGSVCSITPELCRLFRGLRKVCLVPEILEWTDAPTPREKLVKVARNLRLDIKENVGLWVGLFDIFDETAVLQDAVGFTIKFAAGEAQESTS